MKTLNQLKSILTPASPLPNAVYRFAGMNDAARKLLPVLDAAEANIDKLIEKLVSLEEIYIDETTSIIDGSLKFVGVNKASAFIAKRMDATQLKLNIAICELADIEAAYNAETLVLLSSD